VTAILAKGLRKSFGEVRAVEDVSLAVEEGEIFGLLGPNGAGKTTTVRMLATLLRPDAGEVRVLGLDATRDRMAVRRLMGIALQETGLDDLATGRELLTLHARLYGLSRGRARERADELLAHFDLHEAADRRVGEYSGGMRRRIDLASALVHEPRVVFLDEPTVGLDPAARAQLWAAVRRLNREEGTTILLTTHYMEEAERLAGRLAVVDRGRVVMEGTAAQLKARVAKRVVTLSLDDEEGDFPRVARALAAVPGVLRALPTPEGVVVHVGEGGPRLDEVRALAEKEARVVGAASNDPTLDDLFLTTGKGGAA
jgi:ABC-2 type transport system ATP-binding protein